MSDSARLLYTSVDPRGGRPYQVRCHRLGGAIESDTVLMTGELLLCRVSFALLMSLLWYSLGGSKDLQVRAQNLAGYGVDTFVEVFGISISFRRGGASTYVIYVLDARQRSHLWSLLKFVRYLNYRTSKATRSQTAHTFQHLSSDRIFSVLYT